ncbi:junctional protein associated with coronary artery disease isoform X2 [Denticeps clupeoides]|nr:junctional protein associated with coronary artery disease isoform X2 [Denticeps clupeoides]
MSYWRRRGQDFTALLDYPDLREARPPTAPPTIFSEGTRQNHEAEELRPERRRRPESGRCPERDLALQQWRMMAERRQHSLQSEEWRPASGMARHLSSCEGERWAHEQRRPQTAEGAVPTKTKTKSQSLPRMAPPTDGLSYLSTSPSSHELFGGYRSNGHSPRDTFTRHHSEGGQWVSSGRHGVNSAPPSKTRFSRPLRPPSYEVHQQTRALAESFGGYSAPQSRDRTPLPFSRAESRQEYYCPDMGGPGVAPPGYIPPPSYRRQPIISGPHHSYGDVLGSYHYRMDPYHHGSMLAEVAQWYGRQTGSSWPDQFRDGRRSVPCRKVYPVYADNGQGGVQYIPFDDPRVKHISGAGMGGNLLTDADKIRNIQNEIPGITISEDSAFVSPEETLSNSNIIKSSHNDIVNEGQWPNSLKRGTDNMNSTSDLNLNVYPAEQSLVIAPQENFNSERGYTETITKVKTFEPETEADNKKRSKKKVKETMFCLVSVPINMQASRQNLDQNNNDSITSKNVISSAPLCQNQNLSVSTRGYSDLTELKAQTGSSSSFRSSSKAPQRKEIVNVWSLQATADKELCYAGSWPGNQYRNQETQTGSPEISRGQAHNPPSSDTINNGVGTWDSAYGYPLKGQKNLSPSNNSAFSRTTVVQSSSTLSTSPQHNLSRPAPTDHQEAFGQFLLKPVGRRPWDAIEELESINKELQDQIGAPKKSENNPEKLDKTFESTPVINNYRAEPSDTASTRKELKNTLHSDTSIDLGPIMDNWGIPAVDIECGQVRNAASETKNRITISERPEIEETDPNRKDLDYTIEDMRSNSQVQGQGIPVPKESLLTNVGLTVYTPEPCQVERQGIPLLISQLGKGAAPQPTPEITTGPHNVSSPEGITPPCCPANTSGSSCNRLNDNRKEIGRGLEKIASPSDNKSSLHIVKRHRFRFRSEGNEEDNDLDSYSSNWTNELTLADHHLATLLSQEKANSLPSEDLSNLYEVQCAKGIPEHESIEQRAARILGITVPAESLVSADQNSRIQGTEVESKRHVNRREVQELSTSKQIRQTNREFEEVQNKLVLFRTQQEAVNMGSRVHHANSRQSLELPEFPPSTLPLSLPAAEPDDSTQELCGVETGQDAHMRLKALQSQTSASEDVPVPAEDAVEWNQHNSSIGMSHRTSERRDRGNLEEVKRMVEHMEVRICHEGESGDEMLEKAIEEMEQDVDEMLIQKDGEEGPNQIQKDNNGREVEGKEEQHNLNDDKTEQNRQGQDQKKKDCPLTGYRPTPLPRTNIVPKREICLPLAELQDLGSHSDSYDPSRVERV